MEMTLELAIKLRDYYVEHTEVAKGIEDRKKCLMYLMNNELDEGLCRVSDYIFNSDISESDFIKETTDGETWDYPTPLDAFGHSEIIASLKYRINLLNNFINDNQ